MLSELRDTWSASKHVSNSETVVGSYAVVYALIAENTAGDECIAESNPLEVTLRLDCISKSVNGQLRAALL